MPSSAIDARIQRQREEAIARLRSYVADYGRPGRGSVEGERLKGWLTVQRRLLRAGQLAAQRKSELDEILPGWDEVRQQRDVWGPTLTALDVFHRDEARWPSEDGPQAERELARWRRHQAEHEGYMTGERRRLLDDTIGVWSGAVSGKMRLDPEEVREIVLRMRDALTAVDRWQYVVALGYKAERLAPMLDVDERDKRRFVTAAWLSGLGFARPDLHEFLPFASADLIDELDAQYTATQPEWDDERAFRPATSLVARQVPSVEAAALDDDTDALNSWYPPDNDALQRALDWCIMTTGWDGEHLPVQYKINSLGSAYGEELAAVEGIRRAQPRLEADGVMFGIALKSSGFNPAAAIRLANRVSGRRI